MSENQTVTSNILRFIQDALLDKAFEAYDAFIEENELYEERSNQQNVVYEVTEEQSDYAYNDFIQTENRDKEDINNKIKEYISVNCDDYFFMVKITEKIDYDKLREDLIEELLLYLTTNEPYNAMPRQYWNGQARRVPHVQELAKYAKTSGVDIFVERYAPEWKAIAEQNLDKNANS